MVAIRGSRMDVRAKHAQTACADALTQKGLTAILVPLIIRRLARLAEQLLPLHQRTPAPRRGVIGTSPDTATAPSCFTIDLCNTCSITVSVFAVTL